MLAIIRTGGKQYSVTPGDIIHVERLAVDRGQQIEINDVLLVQNGADTLVGQPNVNGAAVRARVLSHGRGPKISVRKFKRRKNYHRQAGHRQEFTQLLVDDIVLA